MASNSGTRTFEFLGLPTELRLAIYEFLPTSTTHHRFTHYTKRPKAAEFPLTFVKTGVPVGILATCRTIHQEAKPILAVKMRKIEPKFLRIQLFLTNWDIVAFAEMMKYVSSCYDKARFLDTEYARSTGTLETHPDDKFAALIAKWLPAGAAVAHVRGPLTCVPQAIKRFDLFRKYDASAPVKHVCVYIDTRDMRAEVCVVLKFQRVSRGAQSYRYVTLMDRSFTAEMCMANIDDREWKTEWAEKTWIT